VSVIRSFDDPRIRLILHEQNRGRCPARNTAMAAARGEWFVFLDSDDELLAGALETVHRDAIAVAPDVVALRYMCIDEHGITSPDPPHIRHAWTYEQYLQSLEHSCAGRASTCPSIRYPDGHAEEGLYHLDLARAGKVGTSPAVVRLYRHDATNQVTRPDYRRAMRWAADAAANVDAVLAKHGEAMARHAPTIYTSFLRDGALQHFLSGHRRQGLRYARDFARVRRANAKMMLIVTLGLIGRVPLAMSQSLQGMIRKIFTARSRADFSLHPR
jgi:glycosyltransferase involved in cell wall biosynthesis